MILYILVGSGYDSTMLPSGKFVLRLPPELHQRLKVQARRLGISLNRLIEQSIERNGAASLASEPLTAPVLAAYPTAEGIIVFGSAVRQERRANSDIDLLIVLNPSAPIHRDLYAKWDDLVEPVIGCVYSPQFSHPPNLKAVSSLWLEVAIEGEALFDPKGSVRAQLGQIRSLIAEGHYVRKLSHGHPYWVLRDKENADAK